MWVVSCEDITPRSSLYGLIRQSPPAPLSFGLSLVRGVSAGCYQPLLPAGPSRRFSVNPSLGAWAPVTAVPRTAHACFSSTSSAFPRTLSRSASRVSRQNDFLTERFSRLQPFLYVQAPKFARLPDRSYRCDPTPQSSRGFYIRAEPASFPPQASDMLTIRSQVIDGVGTYTPRDSQPCRLPAT